MKLERVEQILLTIDKLNVVSVKQLHRLIRLGSYRHTCRVVSQLEDYLHVVRSHQKIVYLNKEGRQLIGSKKEIKKSVLFDHMLLANEVYIYFNCPSDWEREYAIEIAQEPEFSFGIQIKGLTVTKKKTIIPDAIFSRDGYIHLVEIDNTRSMQDNKKKIENYINVWSSIKNLFGLQPKLCIFTGSEKRRREFLDLCKKLPSEIYTFNDIK